MPKEIDSNELSLLEELIGRHPEGMDAASIRDQSGFTEGDRTLQRRLNRLAQEERIEKRAGEKEPGIFQKCEATAGKKPARIPGHFPIFP